MLGAGKVLQPAVCQYIRHLSLNKFQCGINWPVVQTKKNSTVEKGFLVLFVLLLSILNVAETGSVDRKLTYTALFLSNRSSSAENTDVAEYKRGIQHC